jgi:hypothetical protein
MGNSVKDLHVRHQASMKIATWTLAVSTTILWVSLPMLMSQYRWDHFLIAIGIWTLIWIGMFAVPFFEIAGEFIGWISIRLFGESSISLSLATFILSLLAFFSVVGWMLVFLLSAQ